MRIYYLYFMLRFEQKQKLSPKTQNCRLGLSEQHLRYFYIFGTETGYTKLPQNIFERLVYFCVKEKL